MRRKILFIILILFVSIPTTKAQKVNQIKGLLMDSLHNYVIQGASVSIVKEGATKLTKVSLSDNRGNFLIENIPENTPFRLEITHQNYDKLIREFSIEKDQIIDFKKINLSFKDNILEDVVILPPVRMNGDTLEFNADAFDLDTNAVIEDLLNKLPGVMVWGDGKITSNGKEIKNVLVDGKPFFGTNHRIAVQNIPKDAVEKIQVYDTRSEEAKAINEERSDELNIVLKQDKKDGYFGKLGAGYGTRKRYDGDLSFNIFSPKTQATAAFSSNNVNKRMYDIDQLLRNSTFKPSGISTDFNPDFLRSGITKQHVGGLSLQHDFQKNKSSQKRSLFKASYLGMDEQATSNNNSLTNYLTSQANEGVNTTENSSTSMSENRNHNLNLDYEFYNEFFSLQVLPSFKTYHSKQNSSNITNYDYQTHQTESNDYSIGENEGDELNMDINLTKKRSENYPTDNWIKKLSFTLRSQTSYSDNQNNFLRHSETINITDNSINKSFQRRYITNNKDFKQDFNLDIDNILSAFFINSHRLPIVSFSQKVLLAHGDDDQDVLNNEHIPNRQLTYQSKYSKLHYTPTIKLSKTIYRKSLYGRFDKALNINADLATLLAKEDYTSTLAYRNLYRSLSYFTPSISANYNYTLNNISDKRITLSWNRNVEMTTLNQLQPIYDDINVVNRFYGNAALKSPTKQTYSMSYNYQNNIKRGYSYRISLNATKWENRITDSIIYRDNGTREAYLTNMENDVWTTSLNGNLSKPFKLTDQQNLTLELNMNQSIGNSFQYIDQKEDETDNFNSANKVQLYYNWFDKIKLGTNYSINYYNLKSKTNKNNNYSTTYQSTGISLGYSVTKKWGLNSNLNRISSNNKYYTDDSNVWNVTTSYRALKGNNLEIKFSALDLLRENKGVYINSNTSAYTVGTRNNLQNYFMLSLSYFPRKFGL